MIALRTSPALRLLCVVFALLLHAAMAGAFIARTPPADPPAEVEIELVAMVTSEATQTEIPEVAAASMQADNASEAIDGEEATIISDRPDEIAALTPTEVEEPDESEEVQDSAAGETASVTQPTEIVEEKETGSAKTVTQHEEIDENQESESLSDIEPPDDAPAAAAENIDPEPTKDELEPVIPGSELSSVDAVASISPIDMVEPVFEVPDAPQLAPVMRGEKSARPAPVKSVKKTKPPKQQQKVGKKRKTQGQMVAGARESKVATREGNSTVKTSGGKRASAQYRSIVQARLNARKKALQSVVGGGANGLVVVSFSIGSSGRVTRASVVKSSGNGSVDAAARSMVASTSFPPPPGGSFSARLPVQVK
jgi:protein TonB